MDQQTQITAPNYKRIYSDILIKRYPEKKEVCNQIIEKANLSAFDVIMLNEKIFGANTSYNQKLRSYSKLDIFRFLDYQKKHLKLTNLTTYQSSLVSPTQSLDQTEAELNAKIIERDNILYANETGLYTLSKMSKNT